MVDRYENGYGIFWKEENILFFEFKSEAVIDLHAAQQIIADRLQTQKEKPFPVLCIMNGVVNINKAARDYFAQQGSVLIKAVGILANQGSYAFLMASFYIRVNKPQVPTKVFSDKSEALQFLKTFQP